ncbi:hypothetical protein [Blastococcus sp. TBT05-19]|uniref:hypothetical protein n=1 Tax=Blastococcus sp. TBT05-19 TaxID=2250581 RepID=UPI0018F55C0E|nr:hypothetical protein [Blastococcus sp. TBT05-19]
MQVYTVLEEFVRARSLEALNHISAGYGGWAQLPEGLLRRSTMGVASMLGGEAARLNKTNGTAAALALLEDTAVSWITRRNGGMQLSELTFRWAGSNMQAEDLVDILQAVTIEKPFESMTSIIKRFGLPLQGTVKELLQSLARNRHSAAHAPSPGIPAVSLRSMPNDLVTLALAFDVLISRGAAAGHRSDADFRQGKAVKVSSIGLRTVTRLHGDEWRELKVGNQRGTRPVGSLVDVKAALLSKRAKTGDVLLFLERDGSVSDWTTTDLP